jgi:predicted cobalt transporter CbtA
VHRVLMAGAILAGGFTVAPWLKYPPNPPAVGDPDTLAQRQGLYVALICLTIGVGIVATILSRRARILGWPDHRRIAVVVGMVAVVMLGAMALLPPAPDDIPVPAALVWRFRLGSLGANMTLWTVLTLGLAWLVGESVAARSSAGGVSAAADADAAASAALPAAPSPS